MVRNYKRKTSRGNYGDHNLSLALQAISEGMPIHRISREFDIPAHTLRRHRDRQVLRPGVVKLGRFSSALPPEVENELKSHVVSMERRLYGLGTTDLRRLAFDVAEKAGISHPFNRTKRMTGNDWLQKFVTRHSLSLQQPQGTNISRLVGFNEAKVKQFFDLYKELLQAKEYTPSNIWNMDETGLTTVQKPGKVMATKGVRQVGKATSGERGVLVTFICAMNAGGVYLPPMYIFPRVRMVERLMTGAPPQAVGYANPSGWTDSELFLKWLEHFVRFTNSSRDSPSIIILDGHHSHKSLAAIYFCREHGIELLTLPLHSTHKLQPLDRSYFKSLKAAFNKEADSWMSANPGRRITIHKVAEISGKAFLKSATQEKAINGFRTCGIWPYCENVFTEEDFMGSLVTEEPSPVTNAVIPSPMRDLSDGNSTQKATDSLMYDQQLIPLETPPLTLSTASSSPANVTTMSDSQTGSGNFRKIPVVGDGRCLFRSLATGMDVALQNAERDDQRHGKLVNVIPALSEKNQADELRSRVVGYMCKHFEEYKHVQGDIINADLPNSVRYASIEDRITAMSETRTMVGELEIIATAKVIQRPIFIYSAEGPVISKFGENFTNQPLFVQFKMVGQDVGHYDCLLWSFLSSTITDKADDMVMRPASDHTTIPTEQIRDIIQSLSPKPRLSITRPRTRKAESAAILTSSPYKLELLKKQNKSKSSCKQGRPRQQRRSQKTDVPQKRKRSTKRKPRHQNSGLDDESRDEEEWPCLICGEAYITSRPGEVWVQCQLCMKWAHEQCTPGYPYFICPNCESDDFQSSSSDNCD